MQKQRVLVRFTHEQHAHGRPHIDGEITHVVVREPVAADDPHKALVCAQFQPGKRELHRCQTVFAERNNLLPAFLGVCGIRADEEFRNNFAGAVASAPALSG